MEHSQEPDFIRYASSEDLHIRTASELNFSEVFPYHKRIFLGRSDKDIIPRLIATNNRQLLNSVLAYMDAPERNANQLLYYGDPDDRHRNGSFINLSVALSLEIPGETDEIPILTNNKKQRYLPVLFVEDTSFEQHPKKGTYVKPKLIRDPVFSSLLKRITG